MAFGNLKQRADALAREAARREVERNAHAARIVAILRARLATPEALALCFAAGLLVGQRSAGRAAIRARHGDWRDTAENGAAHLLKGPLASAAFRLASTYLTAGAAGAGRAF